MEHKSHDMAHNKDRQISGAVVGALGRIVQPACIALRADLDQSVKEAPVTAARTSTAPTTPEGGLDSVLISVLAGVLIGALGLACICHGLGMRLFACPLKTQGAA
ncbi:MAG: hypothetical protein AAFN59_14235 [Pseudomonadota bacterium]